MEHLLYLCHNHHKCGASTLIKWPIHKSQPAFIRNIQGISRSALISCSITRHLSAQLHQGTFLCVKSDRKMEARNQRQGFRGGKKKGLTTDCHSESVRSQEEGGGGVGGEESFYEKPPSDSTEHSACERCVLYHECTIFL